MGTAVVDEIADVVIMIGIVGSRVGSLKSAATRIGEGGGVSFPVVLGAGSTLGSLVKKNISR